MALGVLAASACDAPTSSATLAFYELRSIGDSAVPATFVFGAPGNFAPLLVEFGVDTIALAADGSGFRQQKERRSNDTPIGERDLRQAAQLIGVGDLRVLEHADCWDRTAPCTQRVRTRVLEFSSRRLVLASPLGDWVFERRPAP